MGGVVSQSIPNFLNGMSQQTPTQRGINQGEDQVNFANNIVDGLSKRPPLDFVANLDSTNLYKQNQLGIITECCGGQLNKKSPYPSHYLSNVALLSKAIGVNEFSAYLINVL